MKYKKEKIMKLCFKLSNSYFKYTNKDHSYKK